jgi:hypothetical protein
MTPFSLRIFVADGDPDGLRIVEKSNWIGKVLVFPRALLPQVKARPELAQTGVYLLLGPRPDGEGEMLYVGEGDPILPRLQEHQSKKDFWTRAIGFTTTTAGQLNKAHVQFLEARLAAAGAAVEGAADNPVRVHVQALAEFALHGAKYAFPGVRLPLAVGVPTSHSAPAFAGVFAPGSTDFVWAHPNGTVRGIGVEPLHPSVPYAAMQDPRLYELLALFDALRVGKVRERNMAAQRMQALIDPSTPMPAKEAPRG